MKYYTIYKTTNLINGKIYIGCHKTKNLDDGYMGSGKILKRAINKYGIDNFTKEILQVFDNTEDMFEMESQLVNEEFVKDKNNYNLKIGGEGGFDYINNNGLGGTIEGRSLGGKNALLVINKEIKEKRKCSEYDKEYRDKISKRMLKYYSENEHPWTGRRHSEESKRKISEANKINQQGENNSNYGNTWIFNFELKENKTIKKDDLQKWLDVGWLKGRVVDWIKYEEKLNKTIVKSIINRKLCNTCKIWKWTDKFGKKGKEGKLQYQCKKCSKKHRESKKEYKKEYDRKRNQIKK